MSAVHGKDWRTLRFVSLYNTQWQPIITAVVVVVVAAATVVVPITVHKNFSKVYNRQEQQQLSM